jgi:hypothetical protein
MKLLTKVSSCFDVPQDSLDELKMSFPGVVHEQTHLLHRMREVRARQCQVLQRTSEAAVLARIDDGEPIGAGQFCLGVEGSGNGVAVAHVGTLQKLKSVLVLRQEQPLRCAVDIDAEEVVKGTQITHGELSVE